MRQARGDFRMLSNICRVCNNLSDATEQALKDIGGAEAELPRQNSSEPPRVPFDSLLMKMHECDRKKISRAKSL